MTKDQLTFFGGADESGGVQIVYGRGSKALLFDFGTAHRCLLDPAYVNTYDPVRPTPNREIRQYVLGKMAPPLLELYDPDQLGKLDTAAVHRLWNVPELPRYDDIAIFIGHMHQDHMSLLPYARKGTPVYMNKDAHSLYRGIVYSGQYPETAATIMPCSDLDVIDFGEFTVQIVEMDHNTVGTSAIIIESPDHKIAVTGDWRRHGRHPERIDRFIEICRRKKIDILMTEGTRVNGDAAPQKSRQETKTLSMFSTIVDDAKGLVYVQMSPRDLERMADMIEIAANKGRKIVMDGSFAAIWHTAIREGVLVLEHHPAITANIQMIDCTIPVGTRLPYEKISLEEVAERKSEFLYFFKFPNLAHLIELETIGDNRGFSHFVHADYSVKLDHPSVDRFLKAYEIIGHAIGNKGHAAPDEISDLIERIAPKTVVPVHTRHRMLLDMRGVPAYYPYRGETISVSDMIAAAQRLRVVATGGNIEFTTERSI